jgi:hypothetical protein
MLFSWIPPRMGIQDITEDRSNAALVLRESSSHGEFHLAEEKT